ncbi:MAG TPA: isoamylase early set domain-containing protein [Actinopolymorphaceae bacterium]|nr:isoamylase early set domain-containing protein [Actinopolymorphaceae bacterium]
MSVRILTGSKPDQAKVRLVLPDDIHDGPVSVVGSFNDWTPGRHKLVRRSNGTRSVTVTVPVGQELRFRYLGSGGRWFDDPEADEIDSGGSVIRV